MRHGIEKVAYSVINDILGARIVVDVDRDATQGCDFGAELAEAGVVLVFAVVGFAVHFGCV